MNKILIVEDDLDLQEGCLFWSVYYLQFVSNLGMPQNVAVQYHADFGHDGWICFYKADDGLGSDIQIYEQSDQLADVIPERLVRQMKETPGISKLHPVRYLLGEIPLNDGKLLWKPFFADIAEDETNLPNPELQEKYNGIAVKTGEDDYTLKVNIYGYDDEMLEELNDYFLVWRMKCR